MTVNTKELDFQKAVNKVSATTILGNVLLSALKLIAGVFGHSGAMISDAVHSLSDVITTVIAWLGVRLSKKQADKEHPYGHDRFECLASLILGALLLVTGIMIGYTGLKKIFAGNYQDLAIPGTIALIAAIVSIVVKEGMFWYTRYYAKKTQFCSFYGRCLASQVRCFVINWLLYRYRRCYAWLSYTRSCSQCCNSCLYH